MAPLDAELAETVKGGLPYVSTGMEANARVGTSGRTVRVAALLVAEPAEFVTLTV
jgi:hypothetical protein